MYFNIKQIDNKSLTNSIVSDETNHTIDECFLNIDIELKKLEFFHPALYTDNTHVKLNDYDISNAEYCRGLGKKLNNQVINDSESTAECLEEDTGDALKYLTGLKDKTNNDFRSKDFRMALKGYLMAYEEIIAYKRTLKPSTLSNNSEFMKKLKDLNAIVCSNIALCYYEFKEYDKVIEFCEKSIAENNFDKAFNTLINCYLNKPHPEIYKAKEKRDHFLRVHSAEKMNKFKDTFDRLEDCLKKEEEVIII